MKNKFYKTFGIEKPIIGMIHLEGDNCKDRVKRALEEITIFEEEGIDGAIIENYHGEESDVIETLKETSKLKTKVVIGINILPNEFDKSFKLAHEYGARFIQLDHVAGNYAFSGKIDMDSYNKFRQEFQNIAVLGGV
jgi:predicted TIM-barrel enzyme